MKTIKAKDLRAMSSEELAAKEKVLKEELYKLNLQRYSGRVDKPHEFSVKHKDIARIETIITERKEKKNG